MSIENESIFWRLPRTVLGKFGVVLCFIFVVLFVALAGFQVHLLRINGFVIMSIGCISAVMNLFSIIKQHERSWLVWFCLLPGGFALLFSLGEILFPH